MFAQHLKICIQDPIGEPSRPHSTILRKMVSSFLDLDLMTSISLSVRNLWANCLGVGTSFLPLSFNLTIICRAVNSSMSPMTFFDASNIVGFLFFKFSLPMCGVQSTLSISIPILSIRFQRQKRHFPLH